MLQVERHWIKENHELYSVCDDLTFKAKNLWELYTSLHHQQHIVFMRISKKAASKRKSSFNNV